MRWCLLLAVLSCAAATGQTAPPAMKFEAVTIKLPAPAGPGMVFVGIGGGPGTDSPGLVRAYNCSLLNFILHAFEIPQQGQVSGPSWMRDQKFEMTARVPDGTTTQHQVALMLQSMLAERFGLKFHYEQKEVPGLQLVMAKNGPKLKTTATLAELVDSSAPAVPLGTLDEKGFPAINPVGRQSRSGRGANHDRWVNETMTQFTQLLSTLLNRPVADATGLRGEYEFEMYWVNDCPGTPGCEPGVPESPLLPAALEQQLGLKLMPAGNMPIQVLVVEHIEKTPTPD